jgi:rod shape determining protein RodA
MIKIRETFKNFYWPLFLVMLILIAVGLLSIYIASCTAEGAANADYALKQFIWSIVGCFFLLSIVFIGYRPFLNLAYVLYACSLILLILVFFMGEEKMGAQRWLSLGSFVVQPSEFSKLALILTLSHYLGSREKNLFQKRRFIVSFILTFIPLIIVLKQPDLGTALIFLPILFCMLFLWGARMKYILISIFLGLGSLPVLWYALKDYQRMRLLTFINSNADPLGSGYTAIQSKIAVGSGQLWGKGLFCGTQNRLDFVPEHHTDFIFCVIDEEGGFLAAVVIILLFLILLKLSLNVIARTTDREARLLTTGVTAMMFFQLFINIGMTIGICPIAGLPLPFISYGGSSLLTYCCAFGFLLSIYKERSIF